MEEKKKKSEAKRRDGDWLKIKEKEAARSSDSFPSTADSQWKAGGEAGTVTVETASGNNHCHVPSCVALGHAREVQLDPAAGFLPTLRCQKRLQASTLAILHYNYPK